MNHFLLVSACLAFFAARSLADGNDFRPDGGQGEHGSNRHRRSVWTELMEHVGSVIDHFRGEQALALEGAGAQKQAARVANDRLGESNAVKMVGAYDAEEGEYGLNLSLKEKMEGVTADVKAIQEMHEEVKNRDDKLFDLIRSQSSIAKLNVKDVLTTIEKDVTSKDSVKYLQDIYNSVAESVMKEIVAEVKAIEKMRQKLRTRYQTVAETLKGKVPEKLESKILDMLVRVSSENEVWFEDHNIDYASIIKKT